MTTDFPCFPIFQLSFSKRNSSISLPDEIYSVPSKSFIIWEMEMQETDILLLLFTTRVNCSFSSLLLCKVEKITPDLLEGERRKIPKPLLTDRKQLFKRSVLCEPMVRDLGLVFQVTPRLRMMLWRESDCSFSPSQFSDSVDTTVILKRSKDPTCWKTSSVKC